MFEMLRRDSIVHVHVRQTEKIFVPA